MALCLVMHTTGFQQECANNDASRLFGIFSQAYIDYELQRNAWFAENVLFQKKNYNDTANMTPQERANWRTWSDRYVTRLECKVELRSPEMSRHLKRDITEPLYV
jgi:hypothetical protein